MSKLFTILLASLGVLLLSAKLKAEVSSSIFLTLVPNITEYKRTNPGKWEPLNLTEDKGFVLGDKNSGGRILLISKIGVYYPFITEPQSSDISLPDGAEITYIELNFKINKNRGQAVLVAGGIGQNYASLVVEVPESNVFETLVTNVYGNDV